MLVVEVDKSYRTLEEIIEKAAKNAKERLDQEPRKERLVKRTGNKKALHQKGKNKKGSFKR